MDGRGGIDDEDEDDEVGFGFVWCGNDAVKVTKTHDQHKTNQTTPQRSSNGVIRRAFGRIGGCIFAVIRCLLASNGTVVGGSSSGGRLLVVVGVVVEVVMVVVAVDY